MMIYDKLRIEIAGKTGTAAPLVRDLGGRGYDATSSLELSEADTAEILAIVTRAERESEFRKMEKERGKLQARIREIDAILSARGAGQGKATAEDAKRHPQYPAPPTPPSLIGKGFVRADGSSADGPPKPPQEGSSGRKTPEPGTTVYLMHGDEVDRF